MKGIVPDSLVGYGQALEEAVRRDLDNRRTRRRRSLAVRAAVAIAVVAALAFGALSIVSRPASGASVVRRAAAAVAREPGTILHVDMLGSQTNGDGSVVTWRDQSWEQESAPWARRQVETGPDGTVTESASTKDTDQVYDPKTDTIYVSTHSSPAPAQPDWKVVRGPTPGTYVLRFRGVVPKKAGGAALSPHPLVLTARQAKALKDGADVVGLRLSKRNGVVSMDVTVMRRPAGVAKHARAAPTPDPDPSSGSFRGQILALLSSGGARVAGHATIDGRDTIEIDSADGHTTYFVDPATYAPVELRTRGTDGGTALRFRTYEKLALEGNDNLLSLEAQHPTAQVDRNAADYRAAEARLFPHG